MPETILQIGNLYDSLKSNYDEIYQIALFTNIYSVLQLCMLQHQRQGKTVLQYGTLTNK